jgi:hypothetical protein
MFWGFIRSWEKEFQFSSGNQGAQYFLSSRADPFSFSFCDWEVLTSELQRYEYAISPTGVITYNAPAGYHDDCVIALALANWRRWESENVGRMMVLRNPAEAGRQEGRRAKGAGRRRRNRVLAG